MTEQIYQVGGTLAQTAASYVERQADADLLKSLRNGEFCYVFNARQMGKSSLLVRTAHRLRQEGCCCALIDFSRIGGDNVSPQQWYSSVLVELVRSLDGPQTLLDALPDVGTDRTYLQQLSSFIETVLFPYSCDRNIIIFLDEIDSLLHLPFSVDDFFAWIRSCYNQRALKTPYRQLTFALFGVTTPSDLIQDPQRTPFNLGKQILLEGLKLAEATPLLEGLQHLPTVPWSAETLLDEILKWTAGQPLLTQKLCWLVSQHPQTPKALTATDWVATLVQNHIISNWQSQDVPQHLRTIRDRLLADEHQASRLLGLYQQILHGGVVTDGSREQATLRLSGLVTPNQGRLRVQNLIYRAIFCPTWIDRKLSQLRPYAVQYTAWMAAEENADQYLLQGLELQQALAWAKNKHLSNEDYRYLSASQAQVQQRTEQSLKREQQAYEMVQQSLQMADLAHDKLNQARQQARQRPLPHSSLWLSGVGLLVTSVIVALQLSGILQFAEWLALDLLFQQHIVSARQQPITIIEITESDLQQLNRFPITDAVLSEAIETIQQSRPAVIGMDIYRDLPIAPGTRSLTQTLKTHENIIGTYKQVSPEISPPAVLPLEQVGFADQVVDGDGKVRRALLSVQTEDNIRYSFSLRLALAYLESHSITPQTQARYVQLGQAHLYPFHSNTGGYVGADSGGYQVLLNYHGTKQQFSTFSLRELLSRQIPAADLTGRIILLGYTAESSNDFFLTPFSTQLFQPPQRMPGVILQANTLAMLLSSSLEGRPLLQAWPAWVEQVWTILWIGMGGWLGWKVQSLWRVAIAVALSNGLLVGVAFSSFAWGWWIPWVTPALGLTLTALLLSSLTDRALFRHRLRQTVIYLHQLTHQQPALFAFGIQALKHAESHKYESLIDSTAQRCQEL